MTATEQPSRTKNRKPGAGTLVWMLALLLVGAGALIALCPSAASWQAGALGGWALAGLMGLASLWAVRRALRAEQHGAFTRAIFGSMALRLFGGGLLAGLVIGFGWLPAAGFVGGLFGGLVIFQTVEIGGVLAAARRLSGAAQGAEHHAS